MIYDIGKGGSSVYIVRCEEANNYYILFFERSGRIVRGSSGGEIEDIDNEV